MVVDAISVSQSDDPLLIGFCANLETDFDPVKALQSFSEYFWLGGGNAWDCVNYSRLLMEQDQQAVL